MRALLWGAALALLAALPSSAARGAEPAAPAPAPAPKALPSAPAATAAKAPAPAARAPAAPAPKAAAQTVAVMPFRDLSDGKGHIGEALRETVTADLKALSGLRVVERADLERILGEQQLQAQRADLDPATAARVGKLLGATLMVCGAYQRAAPSVRLTARFVRVESGEIIGTAKIDGREGELLRLQDRLTGDLLRSAGLGERARRIEARPRPALRSLKVVELYDRAVQERDDLQRLGLLKIAAAEDSAFAYAASDLRALEARLRAYQRDDEAARSAAIADLTRRLEAAADPAQRPPLLGELLVKLQIAGRYRQMAALARRAAEPGYLPEAKGDMAAYFGVVAQLKLRDRRAVLREGEEFLRRFPGSPYFPGAKALVEQAIGDQRAEEAGAAKAAAEADKVPQALRWDLCHLAGVYRMHLQRAEELRLLRACLAVGQRPRAEVLRLLVLSEAAAADFAAARRDLAELERLDGPLGLETRRIAEIPADG